MSDDFDNDDFSWLQDDEQPENNENDDEQPEWEEQPGTPAGAPPGGHLGFTTELPWMQDDEEDELSPGDVGEDDLSWLQEADLEVDADDEIEDFDPDWLHGGEAQAEQPAPPDPDVPAWLRSATDELNQSNLPDMGDDAPEWLQEAPSQPPAESSQTFEDVPDWLQEVPPQPPAESSQTFEDVPDWLKGDETPASSGEPPSMVDETGQLSPDWLASGQSLPESMPSDKTFDEWMREQEEAERVPDLEEQMPELDDLGTPAEPVGETGTDNLPDWFLGMEELDTSDAPEWFTGEVPASDSLSESPVSDWLASQQPDEPEQEAPPQPEEFVAPDKPAEPDPGDLGEDFFAALGEETTLDDDFFAEFSDLPDSDGEPEAEAPQEFTSDELGEDFFASLGDLPDADGEPEAEAPQEPTSDEPGDDFFAEFGDLPDADGEPEAAASQEFASDEPGDDFFASLGDLPDTDGEPEAEAPQEPTSDEVLDTSAIPDGQFLESLGIEDLDTGEDDYDWFALEENRETTTEPDDGMSWLDDLGEIDPSILAQAEADDLPEVEAPGLSDIDSLLASMGDETPELPDTSNLLTDDFDFDAMLDDPAFSEVTTPEESDDTLKPETPDWLAAAGATIGSASAASILRQQRDRSLDELPDRLKRLRERGTSIRTTDEDELAEGVPGIGDALDRTASDVGIGTGVALTPEQNDRVTLLRSLTATEQANAMAAARSVSDEPFLLDEDATLPELEAESEGTKGRRLSIKFDRLMIALIVAAAVIIPFVVSDFRIGDLPPASFGADTSQQAVFDAIDTLQPGDLVLVGMEYGPTAAAELDTTARVLLHHILLRRAQPVIVSQNPVALERAGNLLNTLGSASSPLLAQIGRNTPLRANEDYYVTRYLPGSAIGIRNLSANIAPLLTTGLTGEVTGLNAGSLEDFAQIIVIAERPSDLRIWAEQVAPLTRTPLLAATGFSGEPLAEPYVEAGFTGLLAGYDDTLTYAVLLTQFEPGVIVPEAIETETPAGEEEITPEATETAVPPSEIRGSVIAAQAVNVRSAPGIAASIVGAAGSGTEVVVLGRSADQAWLNIELPNGTTGWVSSPLIDLGEVNLSALAITEATSTPAPTETAPPTGTPAAPTDTPQSSATPEPTSTTPAPTNTPVPTSTAAAAPATATPPDTPEPTAEPQQVTARVIAQEAVNVRSGPGTSFGAVGAANPGDTFTVLGRNADGSWIRIDYPDLAPGQEAWIAAFLLEVGTEQAPAPDESAGQPLVIVMAGSDFSGLLAQPEETETPPIESEATEEADLPVQSINDVIPQAEDRWYAMNLGLVAIIVIIALGTLINIIRALLRRGD